MKIDGDTVSPAVPGLARSHPGKLTLCLQSRKSPNRVFVGGNSGLSSMRWEGGKWIDEGRLPNFTDGSQSLAEQSDGTLWAGSGIGDVLRIEVPSTGMKDAKMLAALYRKGRPGESREFRRLRRRTGLRHPHSGQELSSLG